MNKNNLHLIDKSRFQDFISTLRHMKMCNMRSYYMYKYKEKHVKITMGLQLQNSEIQ
jgi:hypothetical protein